MDKASKRNAFLIVGAFAMLSVPVLLIAQGDPAPPKPPPAGDIPMAIKVRSNAFPDKGALPRRYTDDGDNISPEIAWSQVPANAKELALICDDPDAPRPEAWVHWVIYKIPASLDRLPENISKVVQPPEVKGSIQGKNSWASVGYRGPSPPAGQMHHYHFRVYALDAPLKIDPTPPLTKDGLIAAMSGHILAEGELVGTYRRP